MPDLDSPCELNGALDAFELWESARSVSHQTLSASPLDDKALDLCCHVCSANTRLANMQAQGWEGVAGTNGLHPVGGFTVIGFNRSTVVSGVCGMVPD